MAERLALRHENKSRLVRLSNSSVCKLGTISQQRFLRFIWVVEIERSTVALRTRRRPRGSSITRAMTSSSSSSARSRLSRTRVDWQLAERERERKGERNVPVASVFARCRAFYGGGLDDFARERTARERLTWRRRIIQARSHAAVGQLLIVLTTQGRVRACHERL